MTSKNELNRKLKEIGYEIGPFASKDTLSIVLRLHDLAANKGTNVAKLNDVDLRKNLIDFDVTVGPVTSYTRAIYQRKLLEKLTNETSEGTNDEADGHEETSPQSSFSSSPPRPANASVNYSRSGAGDAGGVTTRYAARTTTTTTTTAGGDSVHNSPLRSTAGGDLRASEMSVPLTRIDVPPARQTITSSPPFNYAPKQTSTPSSSISSASSSSSTFSPAHQQQASSMARPPRRYSPGLDEQGAGAAAATASSSSFLRNPYDFEEREAPVRPYEHRATPYATERRQPERPIVPLESKGSGDTLFSQQSQYSRRDDNDSISVRQQPVFGASGSRAYGDGSRYEDSKLTQRYPPSASSSSTSSHLTASTSNKYDSPLKFSQHQGSASTITKSSPSKKVAFAETDEGAVGKKSFGDTNKDEQLAQGDEKGPAENNLLYYGIAFGVALIVFFLYLALQK